MELQFENVGFRGQGETGIPKEIPVVPKEPTTTLNPEYGFLSGT